MNLFQFALAASILWLARELRQLRRDAGQAHVEMRGRLMLTEAMLSRQPVGDGDRALITAAVESAAVEATGQKGDFRWN